MNSLWKLVLLLCCASSLAEQLEWIVLEGGDWNNPNNWFPPQVPSESDDVYITAHSIDIVILLPPEVFVSSLQINPNDEEGNVVLQGPCDLTADALDLSGVLSNVSLYTFDLEIGRLGYSLAVNGTILEAYKSLLIHNWTVDSTVLINNTDTSSLFIFGEIISESCATMLNYGYIDFGTPADVGVTLDVNIENLFGGFFTSSSASLCSLVNYGTLEVEENSHLALKDSFIQMDGSSLVNGTISANNMISFHGGLAEVSGTLIAPQISNVAGALSIQQDNLMDWKGDLTFYNTSFTVFNLDWKDSLPSLRVNGSCYLHGNVSFGIAFQTVPTYDEIWEPLQCDLIELNHDIEPVPLYDFGKIVADVNDTKITMHAVYGLNLHVEEVDTLSDHNKRTIQYRWSVLYAQSSIPADRVQLEYELQMTHGEIKDFDNTSTITDAKGNSYKNLTYDRVSSFSYNLSANISDCRYAEMSQCQASITEANNTHSASEISEIVIAAVGGIVLLLVAILGVWWCKVKVVKQELKWKRISTTEGYLKYV